MSSNETPLAQLYTNRRISQTETWPVHPDEDWTRHNVNHYIAHFNLTISYIAIFTPRTS